MELDASMLRPIVGQALDAAVAVTVDWSVVPILAGDGQGLGVFRVSSSGRVGDAPRVWSLILKVLPGIPASPTKWNYPAREALAHERGLLEDLPPGAAVLWLHLRRLAFTSRHATEDSTLDALCCLAIAKIPSRVC